MKRFKDVCVSFGLICFGLGCGLLLSNFYPPPAAVSPMAGGRLVSIKQVQEFLKEKDYYYGKIDGLLSPDWKHSKTQAAWDRWYCDQVAMETFEVK